ncbi:MAG TPA: serine hydrolase domain-containing protein [Candidatus Angelobacter sp.]|jgi:CubicO group peptidase (beta-lactamase class C family)
MTLMLGKLSSAALFLFALMPAMSQTNSLPASSQTIQQQVDKIFASLDKRDSPGCALAVLKHGTALYKRGYGMADLEHGIPISPNTVFQIGSASKQFTAMAVILLAEEGKLSLEDSVRKYIPELPDYGPPITLRHLMYHTSGLRNLFVLRQLAGWRWGDVVDRNNDLDLISRQRAPNFKPGDEHAYTNTGYFLLGEVVQRVSHQPFPEFMKGRIFDPLGMKDTVAAEGPEPLIHNRAMAYSSVPGGFKNNLTLSETLGDSNIYTTIEDMARWDENFYQAKVGGPHGIAEMITPGLLNNGENGRYGGGLNVTTHKGLPMIWHSGNSSYRAEYLRFPDQHFSVICLCNSWLEDPSDLARRVADLYLADVERPEPAPVSAELAKAIPKIEESARASAVPLAAEKLQAFAGSYLIRDTLSVRRIFLDGSKLMAERGRGISSELVPTGEHSFLMLGVPERVEVTFSAGSAGTQQIAIAAPGRKPIVADRVDPAVAADMKPYEGNFWNSDVGEIVKITGREGKLWLETKRNAEFELQPVAADIFKNQWFGKITFNRDKQGSVTSFTMSNGEVRSLDLEKVIVRYDPAK